MTQAEDHHDSSWLRLALQSTPHAEDDGLVYMAAGHHSGAPFLDPEKVAYLRRLGSAIRESRDLATTYNVVLLAILAVLTVRHRLQRWQQARKRRRQSAPNADEALPPLSFSSSSSSSSSSSPGTIRQINDVRTKQASPHASLSGSTTQSHSPDIKAIYHNDLANVDVERMPLLRRPSSSAVRSQRSLRRTVASWLIYQPPAIPLIRRNLPSNGVSLFVLLFLGLNVFYNTYNMLWESEYFLVFADRAALVFMVNLPLLYLLAAKNQPLKYLTGHSYESLNIFHRRLGELLCFEAAVHSIGILVFKAFLSPRWFIAITFWEFLKLRIAVLGLAAFFSYELLYLTSLSSMRQRCYELFLATHVVLQTAGLVLVWFHFRTSKPYVAASLAIFLVDRIVWRIGLKSTTVTADVAVLPDGETIMVSANWDIPPAGKRGWSWRARKNIIDGWRPTDHVFISAPVLGRSHGLQAHPFTIASAAPVKSPDSDITHAWFNLLVRAQSGFTEDLLCHALRHRSIELRVDGPYGSSHALDTLQSCDDVVLVAGGSGIAVVFPIAQALLDECREREQKQLKVASDDDKAGRQQQRRLHLLWVMHSDEHRQWIPEHVLDDLVANGLHLVVPPATALAGRPDTEGYVSRWIDESRSRGRDTGVLVSGPDGLNRAVRNTCARAIEQGADVGVVVEKFGW